MLHCLEVAHLCFSRYPGTTGDACRGGRVQTGGAGDACAPLALSTLPQRLCDSQKTNKKKSGFPFLDRRCLELVKITLKDKGLLLGTCNDSDVRIRQVPVERIVITTARLSLKSLQKPHKKNNFFLEGNIQSKSRSGPHYITFGHRCRNPPAQGITSDTY